MKKILVLAQAFCVATVVVELALAGIVMSRGLVTQEKVNRAMAVIYEFDDILLGDDALPKPPPPPSLAELATSRALASLDLQMQVDAVKTGMSQFQLGKHNFETAVSRFKNVKATFDAELNRKIAETRKASLLAVQQALEVLPPKKAKRQILLALGENELQEMAQILQQMAIAKNRKILFEFKTPDEAEARFEILKQMKRNAANADNPRNDKADNKKAAPKKADKKKGAQP